MGGSINGGTPNGSFLMENPTLALLDTWQNIPPSLILLIAASG